MCGNTCGWKSVWKCMKYYLKAENVCLSGCTKHPLKIFQSYVFKLTFSKVYQKHFYIIERETSTFK